MFIIHWFSFRDGGLCEVSNPFFPVKYNQFSHTTWPCNTVWGKYCMYFFYLDKCIRAACQLSILLISSHHTHNDTHSTWLWLGAHQGCLCLLKSMEKNYKFTYFCKIFKSPNFHSICLFWLNLRFLFHPYFDHDTFCILLYSFTRTGGPRGPSISL